MATMARKATSLFMQRNRQLSTLTRRLLRQEARKRRREADARGSMAGPSVALVGRPNVGKSTLFNRLCKKKLAIVNDIPGTTRDFRESEDGRLGDLRFRVIDSGGLEDPHRASGDGFKQQMLQMTEYALLRADVVLFLVDAREGVTPEDEHFSRWLRRRCAPGSMRLIANKAEGMLSPSAELISDCYRLGMGEPVLLSGEHGQGLSDLFDVLVAANEEIDDGGAHNDEEDVSEIGNEENIQLAIVGRPNVGKSTLMNRLLGEDRVITSETAGTTRDPIRVDRTFEVLAPSGESRTLNMRLIDTAGVRKSAKRDQSGGIESWAVAEAMHAIRFANVVAVVLDGSEPPTKQDLAIIGRCIDEGRAFILVVNKCDLMRDAAGRSELAEAVVNQVSSSIPQALDALVVPMSALRGQGVRELLPEILSAFDTWSKRIKTPDINRWLRQVQEERRPPGKNKLKYGTQVSSRPPTFVFFTAKSVDIPTHYERFLTKRLKREFGMGGVPCRIVFRKGSNS